MKKITLLVVLLIGLLSTLGCNTVKGVGRDIEKVGDKMEDAVD
jgi:predicted small secreted protein